MTLINSPKLAENWKMIFSRLAILAILSVAVVASAFSPARIARSRFSVQMSSETPSISKVFGAALLASTLFAGPVLAKDGAGAKLSFFGDDAASSPFTVNEKREDPMYSPYSAYGNGDASVYKKGGKDELSFYKNVLKNSIARTSKIPKYISDKTWSEIYTELTRYNYNQREAMLRWMIGKYSVLFHLFLYRFYVTSHKFTLCCRLAEASKDPVKATAAAKTYFQDINDISEWSYKKNGAKAQAAYDKSVKDLASYNALI